MPALRKPHRIAVLAPSLTIEGADALYAREVAVLLWTACIEVCQRHPGLAVYDAESTPLVPQDGHFAPQHASVGAVPTDSFWASTRRDELVWLEIAIARATVVRVHALARDGKHETFDAIGRNAGEPIHQAIGAWLTARGLPAGALPRRFESVTTDELLATVRVIAPLLVEQARAWTAHGEPIILLGAEDAGDVSDVRFADDMTLRRTPLPRHGRALASRLPRPLRVAALRTLELALHEDLGDLILAADPDHPRALFDQFSSSAPNDFELLRRVIAQAPGWARPYGELVPDVAAVALAPTALERVAGAGIAALCRPGHLEVIDTAAEQLRAAGRTDEALRIMERAARLHDREPRAHLSLLRAHAATDRIGSWLAQAQRSAREHGCGPSSPDGPLLPCEPDQIRIELQLADALLAAGRLDEAIAVRAQRLAGREAGWARHTEQLAQWRSDPRIAAQSYAREGHFRGDPVRTIEAFAHHAPASDTDVAILLDALVATGREEAAPLAWAQHGLGRGHTGPIARLAAARAALIAGEWRRGLEELWRVELAELGRDEQVAIARILRCAAGMPIEIAEAALGERVAIGAVTLARRMARDIADVLPQAAKSSIVLRALGPRGRTSTVEFDAVWIATLPVEARTRRAVDELFAELRGNGPELARADRIVEHWLDVVYAHASSDRVSIAQAAAYVAAQAIGRYLAGTTAAPSPLTGGLRAVAAEALALVRRYRDALDDRCARALLTVFEPLLRRTDRWLATAWLATAERSCGIDERAAGDATGFARDAATVAARILGPEEVAVLSASVAQLHRERRDGWESATGAQATRLALHTGFAGVEEWADATAAQLAARTQELDDAVDALLTASYLAEGKSAIPCAHAARVFLEAGRGPAALAVLTAGLGAASRELRARQLAALASAWAAVQPGVPLAFEAAAAAARDALRDGDAARAEKLARWATALDPSSTDAHRELGIALARQAKLVDALHHLTRGAPGDAVAATRILVETLQHAGKRPEAAAVAAYATPPLNEPAFAQPGASSWRARRAALVAARTRSALDGDRCVTPRALAAATAILADTAGATAREALACRLLALEVREQAHFARDPLLPVGERMPRDVFLRRAGIGDEEPTHTPFSDRVVVPGGKVERASDYVALLRDLAALPPLEALAQFDLDEAGYVEVAKAWAAAMEADPSVAVLISKGLAKRS